MPGLLLEMDPQETLLVPKEPEYGFTVLHQILDLEIDFSTQSLKGRTEITILPQSTRLQTIRLDARQCNIPKDGVNVGGVGASFTYVDPTKALEIPDYILWDIEQHDQQRERLTPAIGDTRGDGPLIIQLPDRVKVQEIRPQADARGASVLRTTNGVAESSFATTKAAIESSTGPRFQPIVISIAFSTTNFRDGLHFVGLNEGDTRYPHVYTKHSLDPGTACCIFPCVDDPAMRCTWEIRIKTYRTLGDALKRRHVAHGHHSNVLTNGLVNGISPKDDADIPLSDEEKLLEMTVVCSGEMLSEVDDGRDSAKKTVTFLCSNIVAAQHIGIAIGPFEQVDLAEYREDEDGEKIGQSQALPLFGYCLPGRSPEVRHVCLAMAHAIDWFMLTFGAYPFSDYSLVFVDDQVNDTEHTASLSICSNRLLFGSDVIDPEMENTRTIVHAIASQWIGVHVVPTQKADRWLTIGLSHLMTSLFMKSLCGNNDYMFRQKTLSDQLVEQDVDRPSLLSLGEILHLGRFEMDFMKLKAPLVLFILDRRLIKATGTAGLGRVISKVITQANIAGNVADSSISTEGFSRLCEKITRYRQTEAFFNQWVLGAGCPKFVIGQRFNKKRLCVEMTISQKQETTPAGKKLQKGSFLREFKEDINSVYAAELQSVFTGPLTIRIHEADGTPYEHIVEIREGISRIEIPYNTKYKRLKRSRRQKERLNAGAPDVTGEVSDDALYYCLGDVLQDKNDMQEWGFVDWDAESEAKMDAESYEWIRLDADFEWLCDKSFSQMPAYMYVSQLQQDRDVVAQQESMLYLKTMPPHPLVSTILTRTLMDSRYFHGIRTLAAKALTTHANVACNWAGLRHLEKAYSEFFCYPNTMMPRSNDFNDRRAYKVELAIPQAMSNIRDDKGQCPKTARQFILDQLRFNDNTNNEYTDNFKIANLLSALANSLIPKQAVENALRDDDEDKDLDLEPAQFKQNVIDELDRHRRMDEWIDSYHNLFTTTVMDCKLKLMKAKVIPLQPTEFAQYLHDGTSEHVRIKAFEALIELGFMANDHVIKLLFNVFSTDPSPFVRNRLQELSYMGFAAIAFAEGKPPIAAPKPAERDALDEGEGALVVEQNVDADLEARKAYIARTTSIEGALSAMKTELQDNIALKEALWQAIKSPVLGFDEQADLLDICAVLYDTVESMILRLKYPRYWKVKRLGRGRLQFNKTDKVRTTPKFKPAVIPKPQPMPVPRPMAQPAPVAALPKPSPIPSPVQVSRPAGSGVRLSFSTSSAGAMKPPKRPLEHPPTGEIKHRSKIVKLSVSGPKLEAIQRQIPSPIMNRTTTATPSASPAPRHSSVVSAVSASPAPSIHSAKSSISPAPSSSGTPIIKIRKPLPAAPSKSLPLAPSAPSKPQVEATPTPTPPQKLKLKLHTKPRVPLP